VTPVQYAPPPGYDLGLELYSAAELRRRANRPGFGGIERVDFHFVIYVTSGQYRHTVDFQAYACRAGGLLITQPGQVHRFGRLPGWDGWLLMFRPELLQPREFTTPIGELELFRQVEALPTYLKTDGELRGAVTETFERMARDAAHLGPAPAITALLRNQLHALMIRLHLAGPSTIEDERLAPVILQRFRRYRTTIEQEYVRWHQVAQYARHLGCSEKSLNRATFEVVGMNAKTLLMNRIILEARRLLAHTSLPVATIGDRLGFDEATNFVKAFRRETGMTPGKFRTRETRN